MKLNKLDLEYNVTSWVIYYSQWWEKDNEGEFETNPTKTNNKMLAKLINTKIIIITY